MNRILSIVAALLVLGIALSRTNDILMALSPYRVAEVTAPVSDRSTAELRVEQAELAGRAATHKAPSP
jgi:hypothetical protein